MIGIEQWFMDPVGAMQLTPDERKFMEDWGIKLSTAYIGMLRCYWYDEEAGRENVVFQTSTADAIAAAAGRVGSGCGSSS